MPEQFTPRFEKAAPAVKTKECNMCGLFKPLSEYYKDGPWLRPACKICNDNKRVTCDCGCRRKLLESNMDIYDCATDMYFHSQPHKDKYDGVKRDRQGFIRAWR